MLPEGWELYSVIDAGKPESDRDYGATRLDGRAHAFGIRTASGEPLRIRATLEPWRGAFLSRDKLFPPNELPEACAWCDSGLRQRDEDVFGHRARNYVERLKRVAALLDRLANSQGRVDHALALLYNELTSARAEIPKAEHRPWLKRELQDIERSLDKAVAFAAEAQEELAGGPSFAQVARYLIRGRMIVVSSRESFCMAVAVQRERDWSRWRELVNTFPCLRSLEVRTFEQAVEAARAQKGTPAGEAAVFVSHVAEPDKVGWVENKPCEQWDTEHWDAYHAWHGARWFVTAEV